MLNFPSFGNPNAERNSEKGFGNSDYEYQTHIKRSVLTLIWRSLASNHIT
ncbi:MAG: hypothetical protein AAF652_09835 [Cyanobacteria bacterium P01_C01_bin.72]